MKSISLIVPVYNAEKYLDNCIKSILNQSFKNFDLILVNDGSTDRSLSICNKYSIKDSRVKVINKKNEGCIKARRTGIENATADYITFVDSDDWIHKSTLKIVNDEIECNHSDIIMFNMYKVVDKFKLIKKQNSTIYFEKKSKFEGDEIRTELASAYLHGHPFPASLCGKVYRKELLIDNGKYLSRINFLGEDLFYNLEIFLKINKVSIINNSLYYYRTGGNTSKFMPYLFDDIVNGYKIQKEVIEEYYQDSKQKRYNGISIMLLNTFKTCLYNIYLSDLDREQIENNIVKYTKNKQIIEAAMNDGAKKYFNSEFLNAIRNSDSEYLMKLGKDMYNKIKFKRIILKFLGN